VLEDCRVPGDCLLGGDEKLEKKLQRGREGKKSRGADALATFEVTRPLVGASALGIAQAAYEWTLEYLDGRSEFIASGLFPPIELHTNGSAARGVSAPLPPRRPL